MCEPEKLYVCSIVTSGTREKCVYSYVCLIVPCDLVRWNVFEGEEHVDSSSSLLRGNKCTYGVSL